MTNIFDKLQETGRAQAIVWAREAGLKQHPNQPEPCVQHNHRYTFGAVTLEASSLPQTKLYPPLLRDDVLPRQRLGDVLYRSLTTHSLTLLSAPAGYGKTSLLAALPRTHPDFPLAWLTLDQDDNDPARFLAALIAALRRLNPACGATARAVLDSLPNPGADARRVMSVLINDVLETMPQPFAMVLDDAEVIREPGIWAALEHLLDHLPPQMHLVVASRRDPPLPLARLRARGQVYELRLADLRLMPGEASAFLTQCLNLNLSAEALQTLQERTEGWPAGLRLLAGSLERIPSPEARAAFLQTLAHTDRHTADFLAEEVLNRQEPELQSILLQTSILEELTPALCQTLTGRADAADWLETAFRRNLFLAQLDAVQNTFRYHGLFAGFLQTELRRRFPEQWAELHRRAAEAQAHEPERAIRHYLKADLPEEAAALVEETGEVLVRQGQWNTVLGWLEALPAELRSARPRLLYLQGVCAFHRRDLEAARRLFEQALPAFESGGDPAHLALLFGYLAEVATYQLDAPQAQSLIERALACSPPVQEHVRLLMTQARMSYLMKPYAPLEAEVAEAFRLAWTAEDPAVFGILLQNLFTGYFRVPGVMEQTEAICRQLAQEIGESPSPLRLDMAIAMAPIHFYRGRLAEAYTTAEAALALHERLGGGPVLVMTVRMVKGWVLEIWGQTEAAIQELTEAYEQLHRLMPERSMSARMAIAMVRYRAGQREEARQMWADLLPIMEQIGARLSIPYTAPGRFWPVFAEGRYAEAEAFARQSLPWDDDGLLLGPFSASRFSLAYLYWKTNRPEQALAAFVPLLAQCERDDMPGRILIDAGFAIPLLELAMERGKHTAFARRLLDLLKDAGGPRAGRVPDTGETLTPREAEVLRLLVAGASNQAIADALTISLHTVKRHVAQILAKLGVASRTEAAARARDLALLPPQK